MISQKVKKIFWSGVAIIALLILTAVIRFIIPNLPEGFIVFSTNLQNTFYWSIPLILIIFISPFVFAVARGPDLHISFDISNKDLGTDFYGKLLITIQNRGETPFTFNRVQFFIPGTKITIPEDGILKGAGIRMAGIAGGPSGSWDSGWIVRSGIPVFIQILYAFEYNHDQDYIGKCMQEAKNKRIKLKLYLHSAKTQFKSRNSLNMKDLNTLIPPKKEILNSTDSKPVNDQDRTPDEK